MCRNPCSILLTFAFKLEKTAYIYQTKTMNRRLHTLLLTLLTGFCLSLQAQDTPDTRSIFSLHAGPSWQVGELMGIILRDANYRQDLRQGVTWEADYWYTGQRPAGKGVKVGPGFIYQGSLYKAAHTEGSDKIAMHYLAPQIGVFFFQRHCLFQLSAGVGYQLYANHSTVYGKPREVSMNKLACNLSAGGEYLLTPRWGISARLDWVVSSSESYRVEYHQKYYNVKHPQSGEGYFGRLSLLFGVNYHF